jgi:Icc protein
VRALELTTVAEHEAVFHEGGRTRQVDGLSPDAVHEVDGVTFRTLPTLGERLCVFATVNDLHFGETECGIIEGSDVGPVLRSAEGEQPYPEVMSRAAIGEIERAEPQVVIAKGDLTSDGSPSQYRRFLELWGGTFGERLFHVRGNHDAYEREAFLPKTPLEIELPGVRLAVIDTTWPGHAGGRVLHAELEWLDELAARSDRPVLAFGHHHVWDPGSAERPDDYFGIRPDDSERLVATVARRPAIHGYFSGHTHRNRVRRFEATGPLPWVEVACVKDFPGAWGEYRVYEGGVLQIHRRISSPAALAWSEKTRAMFNGYYAEYAFGDLADRCFAIRWT